MGLMQLVFTYYYFGPSKGLILWQIAALHWQITVLLRKITALLQQITTILQVFTFLPEGVVLWS